MRKIPNGFTSPEGREKLFSEFWMLSQKRLAHGDHVLDEFSETVEFFPALTVGVETTYAWVLFPLKEKLIDKITEVFELLENDEDEEGSTASAFPRLRIFQRVKSHFKAKILPKLDEIRETVQGIVNCPS